MPDKTTTTRSAATPAADIAGAMTALQKAGLTALPWFNGRAAEKIGSIGAEFVEFLAERIREDVKTQHQLLQCRDIAEAQRIQQTFLQTAADQYAAQTGRMVELGNELMAALVRTKAG